MKERFFGIYVAQFLAWSMFSLARSYVKFVSLSSSWFSDFFVANCYYDKSPTCLGHMHQLFDMQRYNPRKAR